MKRIFGVVYPIDTKNQAVYVICVARGVRGPMQMDRGINGRRKTRKKLGEDERKDEKRTVGQGSTGENGGGV